MTRPFTELWEGVRSGWAILGDFLAFLLLTFCVAGALWVTP